MLEVQIKKVILGTNEFEGVVLNDNFSDMLAFAVGAKELEVGGLFNIDCDGLVQVEMMFVTAGAATYKAELSDFDIETIEADLQRRLA